MKVLILIGMVIVFISAFFSFFVFNTVIREGIKCVFSAGESCSGSVTGGVVIFGFAVIAFFIAIDALVVYIILKSVYTDPYASLAAQENQDS